MKHMKHLSLRPSCTSFFVRRDRSPRTQLILGCVHVAWNKSQKSLTAGIFARNLPSFALCCYVIGLFNRVQTNHKHKRKKMWFGCEQPFLWGSIAWYPKKGLRRRLPRLKPPNSPNLRHPPSLVSKVIHYLLSHQLGGDTDNGTNWSPDVDLVRVARPTP